MTTFDLPQVEKGCVLLKMAQVFAEGKLPCYKTITLIQFTKAKQYIVAEGKNSIRASDNNVIR